MASPFSRTLRSLESEGSRAWIVGLVAFGFLLLLWMVWFFAAELPVYAISEDARLEVEQAPHPVAALEGGRVVTVFAQVGLDVEMGDVLFELDSELEQRRWQEEVARHAALVQEIASLRQALASESAAKEDAGAVAGAAIEEARSFHRAELVAAELAEEEADRNRQLQEQGLTSEMDQQRAEAAAREQRSQAEALAQSVARLERTRRLEASDRRAKIDQLERELTELEGLAETSGAAVDRLAEEIERRQIRASASGRLGELAKVRPGLVLAAGDHLATILPAAALEVIAGFQPSDALARVRAGQEAQLRLDGFPWTEFGSLEARVVRVSDEARDGTLRVACSVVKAEGSQIPLQHGMPGTLVVEIERVSPAALVLRAAGRTITERPRNAGNG